MEEIDLYAALAKVRDNLNGAAMALDELVQSKTKAVTNDNPVTQTDFDLSKINWASSRDSNKGEKTWYADSNTNKDNLDFKKLWTAITKAKEAKGSPWFWTKMPEGGRGYLWIDQSGNGIYRRLKKA